MEEDMLKHIEKELLKLHQLYGFHFMDYLIDEIKEYNKKHISLKGV